MVMFMCEPQKPIPHNLVTSSYLLTLSSYFQYASQWNFCL